MSETATETTVACKDCKYRNNKVNDKRDEDGGAGWCSVKKKYVARRQAADDCKDFTAYKKQAQGKARLKEEITTETPTEIVKE